MYPSPLLWRRTEQGAWEPAPEPQAGDGRRLIYRLFARSHADQWEMVCAVECETPQAAWDEAMLLRKPHHLNHELRLTCEDIVHRP